MSLASQVAALATRIGQEFKTRDQNTMVIRGDYSTDLNTLVKPGMYRVFNAFNSTNHGLNSAYPYGVLQVINGANGAITQIYWEDAGTHSMYYRATFSGNGFGTTSVWYKVTGTQTSA